MNKHIFLFSFLTVTTFAATSCSGSGIKHTRSFENAVYSADLDHDGIVEIKNKTWKETYDKLLAQSNNMVDLNNAIEKFGIDPNDPNAIAIARYEILHQAEELVMSTGTVLPLCNYVDPYLLKPDVSNIYTMNLGFKFMDRLTKDGETGKDFAVTVGTKAETFDPAANSDASTAIALYQCMVGAMRYVPGDPQEGEREGIYQAELTDGICHVEKRVVTNDNVEPGDNTWINIKDCPDLKYAIEKKGEDPNAYEGTARYYLRLNNNPVWSNGEKVTLDDFIYAWKRASSATYNGQPFGMWCQLFDSIRGFDVWNTIGQQEEDNPEDWDEDAKKKWEETDQINRDYYMDVRNGVEWGDYNYEKQGCSGGMIGVMKGKDIEHTSEDAIVIQLVNDCSYFEELLAFTAFMPVCKKIVLPNVTPDVELTKICAEDKTWWYNKGGKSYATTGTLQIDGEIDNTDSGGIKFKKCETTLKNQWKGEGDKIVNSLKFMFIDKDSTMYDVYRTGKAILTNNFPISVIDKLKKSPDWHAPDQIGLYFYTINVNDNAFDIRQERDPISGERNREKLRIAFAKLINRYDIAHNVYKKGSSANGYISTGITQFKLRREGGLIRSIVDPDDPSGFKRVPWQEYNLDMSKYWDTEDYKNHWLDHREQGGFYKTVKDDETATKEEEEEIMRESTDEAIELAKQAGVHYNERTGKFTNFPRIAISTNNGTAHEDVAERIQAYMGLWGIDVDVKTMEWQSFTAARHSGDYSVARQGWIADFNDPRTYLDCARSDDGNNDLQLGKDSWHRSH